LESNQKKKNRGRQERKPRWEKGDVGTSGLSDCMDVCCVLYLVSSRSPLYRKKHRALHFFFFSLATLVYLDFLAPLLCLSFPPLLLSNIAMILGVWEDVLFGCTLTTLSYGCVLECVKHGQGPYISIHSAPESF
jgi:hypothetical protein